MLTCEQYLTVRKVSVLSHTPNIRHHAAGSLHTFTYKYSNTYIDESVADESMADEFKVEESMADNTIPWRMAYVYTLYIIHKLRNIEIPEKKKRV